MRVHLPFPAAVSIRSSGLSVGAGVKALGKENSLMVRPNKDIGVRYYPKVGFRNVGLGRKDIVNLGL